MREIEKQPYGQFEEPQIGQQLTDMGLRKAFDSLDFQNQSALDQNIYPKSGIENLPVNFHCNSKLPRNA